MALIILVLIAIAMYQHATPRYHSVTLDKFKLHWQWLSRFIAVCRSHQVFVKNHHQRKFFINYSIRG